MLSSSEQLCSHCQASVPAGAKFCGNCGQPMAGPSSVSAALLSTTPGGEVGTSPLAASSSQGAEASEFHSSSYATVVAVAPPPTPLAPSSPPALLPIQQQLSARRGLLFAALVLLLLLGAGGAVDAYILSPPHPVIEVSGDFQVNAVPATSSTLYNNGSFHISGQQFWPKSNITFLLDGNPLAHTPLVQSANNGAFEANLTASTDWPSGVHTLTARDSRGYTAQPTRPIDIVTPIYQASLTNDPGSWACNSTCLFRADGYHIQIPGNSVYPSYMTKQVFDNAVIEVTGIIAKGDPTNAEIDVIFRLQQNATLAGYLFRIFPDGTYAVVRSATDGHFTTVLDTTPSSSLKKGLNQQNTLKVVFSGSQFTFFINEQRVDQVSDTIYTRGYIGLGAGGTGTEAIFSNLVVSSN